MILTSVLSLALLGQAVMTGSDKSLEHAVEKSRVIVVAEHESGGSVLGTGATQMMLGGKYKTSKILKGTLKDGEMNNLSLKASGRERLPKTGEVCIYMLYEYAGHLAAVKVTESSDENLKAVNAAIEAEKKSARIGGRM